MASKIPFLFEILERRNITSAQLAAAIGVSSGNVADWKSGRSAPKPEAISKIADYLNCSTDYLLGRTAAPSTDNTSMSSEEKEVLALMSTLNDEGIKQLLKQARYIASDDEYKKGTQSDIAKEA